MDYSAIDEFSKFLKAVLLPAVEDVEKNLDEKSRKHVQKLIYTNLVDRFDGVVDQLFFSNVREPTFLPEALKDANEPITQAELFELLLKSSELDKFLDDKLRDGISNVVTRNNHVTKLRKLFQLSNEAAVPQPNLPRVNISTGEIKEKVTPHNSWRSPCTVFGYADWLYARRNSIVHGNGTSSFLERDRVRIKKNWKFDLPKAFKISTGSVRTAARFYSDALDLLRVGE